MYVPFQDATVLPIRLDPGRYTFGAINLPRVDAIAARRPDGNIVLSLVNLDPTQPVTVRARLSGTNLRSVHGQQLTAPRVDSVNTFDAPKAVVPQVLAPSRAADGTVLLTLPAKSVTVVQID
jgi:alpha-N-arabinofuranosidase